MSNQTILSELFKTEYRKIISVLCKLFGIAHLETAEDITLDTFLLASEHWKDNGLPDNPTAWLYTVAKNKTKDYLKRNSLFANKISPELVKLTNQNQEIEIDLTLQNINDSQLKMMFAICNPILPVESQVGLALRILCGFGIEEIAEAFLSNKETINKRLFRAKEKLRIANIKIELPENTEINNRLENVLRIIYLLFNEGYYSSTQNNILQKELCLEAMRLNYMLIENESTNLPIVNALLSLMCFHASRFDARMNEMGETILYEEQDRSLWNDELISKGNLFLIKSAEGSVISKYHLEASIAYWHCTKTENIHKWEAILQLYNQLLMIDYSPIIALNRTYALSKANGKEQAIIEARKLKLLDNHLYYSLLGNLYTNIDNSIAIANYQKALSLSKTNNDSIIIQKHLSKLTTL